MSKKLVAYFSATDTTKEVAERLARIAGADLYRIEPEVPYTAADLDWRDKGSRFSVEMGDKSFRPAIKATDARIAEYDTVYLGFPIWDVAPKIVNSFLEANDFSGKKLVVFATADSSNFGNTQTELSVSLPEDAEVVMSRVFHRDATDEALEKIAVLG
ncbi:MAG: flavodoxin [Atopobiaceae bacterium]|nr:flavodoxin [Atopobiaceae bacterium]